MNARILRRFVILLAVATGVMLTVWTIVLPMVQSPPGDYETRQGDILLGDGKFDEALTRFDEALAVSPDHRGALMGRALVFIQSEDYPAAEAELTYLIRFLTRTLQQNDLTGRGALAAAYANRGIVRDRLGHYRKALEDYVEALRTDEGSLAGPGLFEKIIYGTPRPSTVRKRAQYIHEQLQLPPEKRLLRVPEIDSRQRMHKP